MARQKKTAEEAEIATEPVLSPLQPAEPAVRPLEERFGNGDMNSLKEKLNETIAAVNEIYAAHSYE